MKKTIIIIAACATFIACNNAQSESEREKADSIAAAKSADSMLQAAASSDTLSADHTQVDSAATDSLEK